MRKLTLFITALAWLATSVRADVEPIDYAFALSAQAVANPPSITIRWPQKAVPQIQIRRKLLTDANWGPTVTLAGNATTYIDTTILAGRAYEYEFQGIIQDSPRQIAYGYICAGANVGTDESRGKVLLLVDNRFAAALAPELETLRKDLLGDGWKVVRRDVSPSASPPEVKSQIRDEYNADPANMRAVFIIGHIAVPYSGVLNPDMHADHLGAWPADVYYGEMDGEWTDHSAYKVGATYSWNNNVPGDGKFDQSTIPGRVELQVGRVDFYDMPSFLPRSELDLLRNYLRKDRAFRHRTLNAALRGLIRDNFKTIDGDAPAVDAWRAFPALFGPGNYVENGYNQFFPVLQNESYLFAYAGGGGDWEKADGVGTTANFVNGDPQAIFYLLHGSYFGDWNTTDNFLRSAIATPNYGLVSIWSSLPHWYFHPMALGETIGFATQLTQNNRDGIYRNSADLSIGQVHISMMGDPTIRAFPLAPPSNFQISVSDKLLFNWNPSWQAVEGYNIYYATSYDAAFTKTTRRPIAGNSFEMPLLPAGHYIFMIKSSALQTTGSGSFNNLSQGIFLEADLTGTPPPTPQVTITASDATGNEDGDAIVFTLSRDTGINDGLNVNLQFGGSATLGQDFQAPTTVAFQPGNSVATINITPTKDTALEPAENVTVTVLGGSGYVAGTPSSATATIAADPLPPTLTITAKDASGDEKGDAIEFTLTRTTPIDVALTARVQFSGSATLGVDYQASTNLSFAIGSATASLRITPIDDAVNEIDETVTATLIAGAGYQLGTNIVATATIKGAGECKISDPKLSTGRAFSFQATGFANRPYRIESRTPTGAWTSRTNAVAGADGAVTYSEPAAATAPCLLYRVVWE